MATNLDLEEQEQLDQLKHFWNTWGTLISSVLLVVMGALAAWNGYQYWQNRQGQQAAALADAVEVAIKSGDEARMEQAFSDLKASYASTTRAAQMGLAVAKTQVDKHNLDGAKATLAWVADKGGDKGLQALARLRLSSVLMEQKAYDEALKQLTASFAPEFDAIVADRKGDIYLLQDKKTEAIAAYTQAFKRMEEGIEYRRLVESKLNALGVQAPMAGAAAVAAAAPVASGQEVAK